MTQEQAAIRTAEKALLQAIETMSGLTPNGRDYNYPAKYHEAMTEHEALMVHLSESLNAVRHQAMAINLGAIRGN